MEQTMLAEVTALALLVGFWFVALVASIVPVEGRRLPAILRAVRFVFRNERDPAYVGLATSVVVNKWSVRLYRVALGGFVLFGVATLARGSTGAFYASALGSEPFIVTLTALLLLLGWAVYVIVEFRRASPK